MLAQEGPAPRTKAVCGRRAAMPSGSGGLPPKTAAVVAGAGRPDSPIQLAGATAEYHPVSGYDGKLLFVT